MLPSTLRSPTVPVSAGAPPAPRAEEASAAPTLRVTTDGYVQAMVNHAHASHQNLQDLVKMADQKASTLVAVVAVVSALAGGTLVQGFHKVASGPGSRLLLAVGGMALALTIAAAACAVVVFLPRSPRDEDVAPPPVAPKLMWVGDVAPYFRDPAAYVRAVLGMDPAQAIADVAYENLKVSWIVIRKVAWMRRAVWMLLAALLAWAATVGLAAWYRG